MSEQKHKPSSPFFGSDEYRFFNRNFCCQRMAKEHLRLTRIADQSQSYYESNLIDLAEQYDAQQARIVSLENPPKMDNNLDNKTDNNLGRDGDVKIG